MSKIGRKPIDISALKVNISGREVVFSGPKGSGSYVLPEGIAVQMSTDKKQLSLLADVNNRMLKALWGLHRSLLSNKLRGCTQFFERAIDIIGLRYKAVKSGKGLSFALGYNNDVQFDLPAGVVIQDLDKSGQKIILASADKELLGLVCSQIRALRPPEPYKGTGIKYRTEVVARKDGKARSS